MMNIVLAILNVLGIFEFVTVNVEEDVFKMFLHMADVAEETFEFLCEQLGVEDVKFSIGRLDAGVLGTYNLSNKTVTLSNEFCLFSNRFTLTNGIEELSFEDRLALMRETIAHELVHAIQRTYKAKDYIVSSLYSKAGNYYHSVVEVHARKHAAEIMKFFEFQFKCLDECRDCISFNFISKSLIMRDFDNMMFYRRETESVVAADYVSSML